MNVDRQAPANAGRALLIVHQKKSRVGRVGRILRRRGYTLDIRCPNFGHELPPSPDSYDLVTIFGGPMSVNDAERMPGIAAELDFIPRVLEARTPLLAICLGAQLLARVLGSEIRPHPEGLSQIGYAPIYPTPAGARYFDGPLTVYHWNSEGFELPPDTVLLARADRFPNQAFRYGKAVYGLQFHADVTPAMVDRWTRRAADHLERPGA
ncbi:MAG: glutamine amidotransferase, partial [Alphaproteobacteria bacterium]